MPPHANAAAHKAVMARLDRMSAEEVFQTAVEAGIYNRDGSLTKPYRASKPPSQKIKAAKSR